MKKSFWQTIFHTAKRWSNVILSTFCFSSQLMYVTSQCSKNHFNILIRFIDSRDKHLISFRWRFFSHRSGFFQSSQGETIRYGSFFVKSAFMAFKFTTYSSLFLQLILAKEDPFQVQRVKKSSDFKKFVCNLEITLHFNFHSHPLDSYCLNIFPTDEILEGLWTNHILLRLDFTLDFSCWATVGQWNKHFLQILKFLFSISLSRSLLVCLSPSTHFIPTLASVLICHWKYFKFVQLKRFLIVRISLHNFTELRF